MSRVTTQTERPAHTLAIPDAPADTPDVAPEPLAFPETPAVPSLHELQAQIAETQRQIAALADAVSRLTKSDVEQSGSSGARVSSPDAVAHATDPTHLPDVSTSPAVLDAEVVTTDLSVVRQIPEVVKRKQGQALTVPELAYMLALHRAGKSQTEIARKLNCNQGTISRHLAVLADTTDLARTKLKAGAAKLAEKVVKSANVEESLEVLDRLDVLEKKRTEKDDSRVQVLVGIKLGEE